MHLDDPTQWDVGEYVKAEMATLEGLPLKSGALPPGGTQTGTPKGKETLTQLRKHSSKSNTMEVEVLVNNENYPL